MIKLNYLITGTGRCGTNFMARVLHSCGICCGHETIFDDQGINVALERLEEEMPLRLSWVSARTGHGWWHPYGLQAESSYMAAPYLAHDCLKDTLVVHIVRHPLEVISSFLLDIEHFCNPPNPKVKQWEDFIYFHLPELLEIDNPIERVCLYYIKWNSMIEKQSNVLHKIETDAKVFLNSLGVQTPSTIFSDKTANKWGKRDKNFSLEDIPNGKIKDEFVHFIEKYQYPHEIKFEPIQKLLI